MKMFCFCMRESLEKYSACNISPKISFYFCTFPKAFHMHVVSFILLMTLFGSAIAVFIGVSIASFIHLFGRRSMINYGVWTLMDALVLDLFLISGAVTVLVWPLISSSFIFALKHATGFIKIDHFLLPDSLAKSGKEMAAALHHSPIFSKTSFFSLKSFQVMAAKSTFIAFAVFSFVVMPTCAFVTVFREQKIARLEKLPLSCAEMHSHQALFWGDAADRDDEIFESLCWKFSDLFFFVAAWCASVGALLGFMSASTAALQFGKHDLQGKHLN